MAERTATPPRPAKRGSESTPAPFIPSMDMDLDMSPARRRMQSCIRSSSVDELDKLLEQVAASPRPRATPRAADAAAGEIPIEDPWSLLRRAQRAVVQGCEAVVLCGEDLLARAEPSYPMLTAHVEFLFYGLGLAVRSVKWFRFGFTACYLGFRLVLYSMVLLPAFLKVAYLYYHDPRIRRRIPYYKEQRNYVDLYIPQEAAAAQEGKGPKVPVVIAVMGGAWVMGHRAWNAQLGQRLMDFGVLVVAVDYRNFPIAYVPEMVDDLNRAISWTFSHIEAYGGDASNVMLIGQSAGAHLSALLLLEHGLLEARGEEEQRDKQDRSAGLLPDGWSTRDLKLFLGVSGAYDLVALESHLISRGIYHRILYSLTVDGDLAGCSPTRILRESDWRAFSRLAAPRLPPMHLFHGGKDKSVPVWSSKDFAQALKELGVSDVQLDLRPGYTHTYPVIEGPMAGDDPQVELMLPVLFGEKKGRQMYKECPGSRMWPQRLIDVASVIMPY